MRDAKLEVEKFIYMLIPKIVIGLITITIIFSFYIYFSALYEKGNTYTIDQVAYIRDASKEEARNSCAAGYKSSF